jgi:hypothetical protein
VKSGKVLGGSKPRVVCGWPLPLGPWHPMHAASKISFPVSSFSSGVVFCANITAEFNVNMINRRTTVRINHPRNFGNIWPWIRIVNRVYVGDETHFYL